MNNAFRVGLDWRSRTLRDWVEVRFVEGVEVEGGREEVEGRGFGTGGGRDLL